MLFPMDNEKINDKRNKQCSCGSRLKCRETINNIDYVICVGIGCNKKWLAKRDDDKNLQLFTDVKNEFNG